MKNNTILGAVAAVLLLLSIFSYRQSVTRAERFERGQKFLAQLNPDEIAVIDIKKKDEGAVLRRDSERFVVTDVHNYPAKNDAVNRFLRDALDMSLEKEIGSGDALAEELGVQSGHDEATEIQFTNDAGKLLVHFIVGKPSDDGRGAYVTRLDGEDRTIYLTSRGVFLNTQSDNFLDKEIADIQSTDLAAIEAGDFQITKGDNDLELQNIPAGKQVKAGEISQISGALTGLRYDKVYLADDPEVTGLTFDRSMTYKLDDESSYVLTFAQKDERTFLRIEGDFAVESVRVDREASEEELKETSEILSRADELKEFNAFHGSWVYELTEVTANKFLKSKADLVEDPPAEEEG